MDGPQQGPREGPQAEKIRYHLRVPAREAVQAFFWHQFGTNLVYLASRLDPKCLLDKPVGFTHDRRQNEKMKSQLREALASDSGIRWHQFGTTLARKVGGH